ncbi:hypothetical protein [Trinickia mobilis]|uniref:hypothetical protein n=1 Tax=Trinickia mobilis TaxID=2816356 RepID=UPI001A8F133F|nr:hypothetical protein [Trinickia mobilis]
MATRKAEPAEFQSVDMGANMHSAEEAKRMIYSEITGSDQDAASAFLARYGKQSERFAELMAQAMIDWEALIAKAEHNEKIGLVANLVYCAITLHIQSMKLFLSGHIIAAGNLSRQVTEAIATALLSSGKTLPVLDRFVEDKYSTQKAVAEVQKQRKILGLKKDGVNALAHSEKFYHRYSHLTLMTIGAMTSFKEPGFYIGASFDEGKTEQYDKEIASRIGLAEVFPNFVAAVEANIAKW